MRCFSAFVLMALLLPPLSSANVAASQTAQGLQDTPPPRLFLSVPYVRQEPNLCGAAALAMVLQYWGSSETQHTVREHLPAGSLTDDGIEPRDLEHAATSMGFVVFTYGGDIDNLRHNVRRGRPVVVELRPSRMFKRFHYVVVVGFDDALELFLIHDPAAESFREISFSSLRNQWTHSDNLTMLVVPEERE